MAEPGEWDDAAARLRRHWDGVVRGAPEPDGLDPALAETVRRLHALDGTPGPSRATIDRIRGELMNDAATPSGPVGATMGVVMAPNGRVPGVAPAAVADEGRRRPSPVAELATAAIVVLSVALAALAYRTVEREPGDGGVSGIGAPVATEGDAVDVPGPEECRVAPRSRESALVLLGDPAGRGPEEDASDRETALPPGTPADAQTVAAVTATVRELHACENAGDPLRGLALKTDRYLRLGASAAGGLDAYADVLATPPVPHPEEERSRMSRIREVLVLPDGRVGAVVDGGGAIAWPGSGAPAFLVFAADGDRYLVDEARPIVGAATPTTEIEPTPTVEPTATLAPGTGSVAATVVYPNGTRIVARPGACFILTGTRELPPVCDDEASGSGNPEDADPSPGVVRIDGLAPGPYVVSLRRPPDGFLRGNAVDLVVDAGEVQAASVIGVPAPELTVTEETGLYAEPSTGAPIVTGLAPGTVLRATDPLIETDGGGWWSVIDVESGDRGFVRADVVAVSTREDRATAPPPTPMGASPVPTETNGAEADAPSLAPTYGVGAVVVVIDDRVNLRESPSDSAGVAAELARGTRLAITGAFVDGEQRDWWPVSEVATGATGYVREDFVAAEEDQPVLDDLVETDRAPIRQANGVDPTPTADSRVVAPPTFVPTATAAPVMIESAALPTVTPVADVELRDRPPVSVDEVGAIAAEAARLRATVAALEQEQGRVRASATALAAEADGTSLEPTAVTASVQVDADGLLVAEAAAEAALLEALHGVLDRYEAGGCRIGFLLISGHGADVAEGVALARATELLLRREFPEVARDAAAETSAVAAAASRGRVDLRLFPYRGCDRLDPTPTSAAGATSEATAEAALSASSRTAPSGVPVAPTVLSVSSDAPTATAPTAPGPPLPGPTQAP